MLIVIVTAALLVPTLPIIVHYTEINWIQSGIHILFLIFVLLNGMKKRNLTYPFPMWFILIFMLLIVKEIVLFFTLDEVYYSVQSIWRYFLLLVPFFMLITICVNYKKLYQLIICWILFGLAMAVLFFFLSEELIGSGNYAFYIKRTLGGILNPININSFAYLFSQLGLFCTYMMISDKRYKAFYVITLSFFIMVIIMSMSRGGILSFVSGLLVFFFAIKRDFKVRNLLKLSICILSIIVLLSIVVFSAVQDFENWFAANKERWVSGREGSDESVKLRQFQDKWYWERFLEKPLMGHGLTLNEYFMDISGEAAGMAHNQYIKILATSGLVGAMFHVVFLLSIFILIKNRVTGRWRPLFFSQFFSLLIQAIFAPIDINLFTFLGFVLAVTKVELLEARNAAYKYHYQLQKLYRLSPV